LPVGLSIRCADGDVGAPSAKVLVVPPGNANVLVGMRMRWQRGVVYGLPVGLSIRCADGDVGAPSAKVLVVPPGTPTSSLA